MYKQTHKKQPTEKHVAVEFALPCALYVCDINFDQ